MIAGKRQAARMIRLLCITGEPPPGSVSDPVLGPGFGVILRAGGLPSHSHERRPCSAPTVARCSLIVQGRPAGVCKVIKRVADEHAMGRIGRARSSALCDFLTDDGGSCFVELKVDHVRR